MPLTVLTIRERIDELLALVDIKGLRKGANCSKDLTQGQVVIKDIVMQEFTAPNMYRLAAIRRSPANSEKQFAKARSGPGRERATSCKERLPRSVDTVIDSVDYARTE